MGRAYGSLLFLVVLFQRIEIRCYNMYSNLRFLSAFYSHFNGLKSVVIFILLTNQRAVGSAYLVTMDFNPWHKN